MGLQCTQRNENRPEVSGFSSANMASLQMLVMVMELDSSRLLTSGTFCRAHAFGRLCRATQGASSPRSTR